MRPKKTFKSLAELSTDALGVIEAEPEKITPPDSQLLLEALRKIPPLSLPRIPDFRGLRDWGINE